MYTIPFTIVAAIQYIVVAVIISSEEALVINIINKVIP